MRTCSVVLSALFVAGCASVLHADDQLQPLHGSCNIAPSTEGDRVQFKLERDSCEGGKHGCNMNDSDMPLSNFTGFTLADLKNDGTHVDAVIASEAGKLTCSGTVHDLTLNGDFTFVPDPAFVARMAKMGFTGYDSEKLEAYTLFHIETSWIQALQSAGVTGITTDNIIALRIFKVDPAYVKSMSDLGFPNLPAEKLIAFRIHGVNPEEVKQYRAMGYQPNADELIQMRIFKVTPEFIQHMQARGLNNLTIAKLVQIRIFKLAE
ncbi:hypothetical protein H7849_05075 [Alloacidobacterium dinghuense]|uniref:Uncharacterized protein n=1 Tax=Alloacidobacterium dinghuense TaxID=2763107 RepID=A0A7G8BLB5_9BACT|nr:hypothetical protein [Alloacidobacterium dinghuense]QNI33335.1 hypothetical protein H7849_05075 [Alloacidobacterium dinghuense]